MMEFQLDFIIRLASTRARTRLGRLCHFGILSASDAEKCANHRSLGHYYTNLFVLTADIPGSVLGINPEGIKTVSGEYAERLLNECGFTKFGFRVFSAPSGRQVLHECALTFSH